MPATADSGDARSAALSLDRAAHIANGYTVVRQLIDADTCARLRAEAFRFAARRDGLAVDTQLIHRSALLREFVTRGPQVALAVELLGPNVCFTHQQYIVKHPDERLRTDIPWHQDNGYGRLEPPRDLTVWIALDDCTTENGCLWVLPGSERRGLLPHHEMKGLRGMVIDEPGVALPMRAGDAALFGSLLLHRSLPNRTETARVALYLRYCDPHVVMVSNGNRPVLDDAYSWMVAGEAD
jgi:ectoine hydroxylase-related dioxygenase (phytanoyl-CoA dioxygenase family)